MAARAHVAVGRPLEPAIESAEELPQRSPHLPLRPQEQRRERRAQRERVERRDQHRHGDRHRELLIHPPRDARDECRRHEHGRQDERDRHHRSRDLLHRLEGGVARRESLLDVVLNGLDDDDGVVHHEADGEHEPKQRQGINGEAEKREHHERADQGHRNCERRDQRGPEALQEDEDHDDDEDQRLDQGLDDLLHPLAHRESRVERRHVVEVGGKPGLHLVHQLCRPAHRFDGVGARELVDGDDDGGLAVQTAAPDVVLRPQLHAAHVPEPNHGAVRLGADHNVLEVGQACQAALRPHGERELLRGRGRVPADLPGRVDGVLSMQRAGDLVDRDVELRQLVRIDPHAHGVLRRAEDDDLPDPGHARHRIVDVDVRVVSEEERIVRALGRVQHEDAQRAADRLLDRDALVHHVGRQLRGRLRVAEVRQDLVQARVGGDIERHPQLGRPRAALVERGHVEHLVHAAHLLLDRRGHRLLERYGVGARIPRGQQDFGWRNIGIQRDGELHEGDEADEDRQDRNHHRDDRPVDEESRHDGAPIFRRRPVPARPTRCEPSDPAARDRRLRRSHARRV